MDMIWELQVISVQNAEFSENITTTEENNR